jgi:hypothetical protein
MQTRLIKRAAERPRLTEDVDRSIQLAQAVAQEEEEEARQTIGYIGRIVVQATLPHSDPHAIVYERTNAHQMTLRLTATSNYGLPYGSLPRLLLVWMTTEAVRTKDPTLALGHSFNEFLGRLALGDQGGQRGDRTRLRNQLNRLLRCVVSVSYTDPAVDAFQDVKVADSAVLWWHPHSAEQRSLWGSTVLLTDAFFREVTSHSVPLDMAVVGELRRSPLALDIYGWLTWRFSFLSSEKNIPWEYLEAQFGAAYARRRAFRAKFVGALQAVRRQYPDANAEPTPKGLLLRPSRTSIPPTTLAPRV